MRVFQKASRKQRGFLSTVKQSADSLLGLLNDIRRKSNVEARHLDNAKVETGQPSASDHRSLHVLVAEDNRVNQLLTLKILERRGHRVVVVNDGKAALRALEKDTFDLVLMDVQLPEMGGLAATAAIREQEQSTGRHLPIVAMTAHAMQGDRERCLDGGMDAYLPRPIDAEGLIQMIEALAAPSVDADASRRDDDGSQTPAAGALRVTKPHAPDNVGLDARDIFDPAPILASVEGDEEVLRQVVELFSEDAQAVLSQIRDAIERQDPERLTVAALSLQGAVTNFGAQRAVDAARKMESLGRHKDLDGARAGLGWLEDEVNRLRHALSEFVTPSDRCVPTDAESVFRKRAMTPGDQESSRILIVDDDQDARRLMRHELERDGYLVEEAADGGSAIDVYQRTSPDIVLMDAHMPDMDGFTACSEIRKQPGGTTLPILIMMSLDDGGSIADAFHAGATDCLSKPLHWAVLRHRLRRVIEAGRAQKRIDHLAHHDALTGLPNRLLFLDRLQQALARARRYKEMVAVVNLDLNGFKQINDTMGHEAGDQLLMGVARRLVTFARDSDTVARFGGDEFVLLIGTASDRGVGVVVRHILDALSKPFRLQQGVVSITTSIGAALYPTDGTDMQTLLTQADTAKYRAKRQGRNVFQFFSRDTAARISTYQTAESTLRAALEGGECSIRYRPVVDSTTTEIVAAEAIVSWPQPELAALPATALASLAETSGLITTFQAGLLARVCADISEWQRPDRPPFRVALSLSARPLMQSDFVDMLRRILTETGLDPGLLELDLSDATLMQNPAQYLPRLGALKALGVRLAVSDFGTGCSSLSYLRRCPIERLKIAPSLIGHIPDDEDDSAIVTTIIGMAHNLGLRVVADGVTAEKQLKFLRERGCEAVQGDYVGRAVRAGDVTRLIAQRETRGGAVIVQCTLPYSAWTRH